MVGAMGKGSGACRTHLPVGTNAVAHNIAKLGEVHFSSPSESDDDDTSSKKASGDDVASASDNASASEEDAEAKVARRDAESVALAVNNNQTGIIGTTVINHIPYLKQKDNTAKAFDPKGDEWHSYCDKVYNYVPVTKNRYQVNEEKVFNFFIIASEITILEVARQVRNMGLTSATIMRL
mmetsp:Transcript_31904/g.48212  ORF Transcript_31904/g.48212 Transcript_31904/m.48212 type:complete len:180 (+) Transcript_31904:2115-2654(+)